MSELFSQSEMKMWGAEQEVKLPKLGDDEINAKYAKRELRIVTESNREQLPNFIEAFKRNEWMNLRPFYQRRPRWDRARQSKLIESFIMNIPVPPLFVYEADLAKYEVMDGQQRITAVLDFYKNLFELEGLEQWPELNGRVYDKLPSEIRKGLDRRSISYIVMLKESASTTEEEMLLRQQVFERLNTGGIELSKQEIRNCLYTGKFNSLLKDVTKDDRFRAAWGIPKYDESEETFNNEELLRNRFFVGMADMEIALRFFALRHVEKYRYGMKWFLDLYMVRARQFKEPDLLFLKKIFEETLDLAFGIFGDKTFHLWDPKRNEWSAKSQVAFADAVMVACSQVLDLAPILRDRRERVVEATKTMFVESPPGTFTGQRNTKKDVEGRIELFRNMLRRVATE